MVLAVTGQLRRSAALLATVAVIASVASGCGGGGSETVGSETVKTTTPPVGQEKSAPAFVGKIEKSAPEQIARVCLMAKAKGKGAAFANFKKGYALAFPDEKLPPKKVFAEILKHCD